MWRGAEPSAAALAEALFHTMHALKVTRRQCLEEADPTLRALSLPRGRLLMALALAERAEATGEDRRVRMGELAETLGVTPRNVTTIVDGLEGEGLIVRRPDPTDRRAILLELTPAGREQIAEVDTLHREIAERFFEALGPEDRRELLRLLAKVRGAGAAQP